ncbi:unnamed protein product, partial [marine sediment metagenome]
MSEIGNGQQGVGNRPQSGVMPRLSDVLGEGFDWTTQGEGEETTCLKVRDLVGQELVIVGIQEREGSYGP